MPAEPSSPIFRVDVFNVPARARGRFLDQVEETHRVLRTIPGFVEDHILEQTNGVDAFNIVTMVRWKDESSVRRAKAMVSEWHARIGFSPRVLMKELGVEAAIGEFRPVEPAMMV
jgi:hypothetical protein